MRFERTARCDASDTDGTEATSDTDGTEDTGDTRRCSGHGAVTERESSGIRVDRLVGAARVCSYRGRVSVCGRSTYELNVRFNEEASIFPLNINTHQQWSTKFPCCFSLVSRHQYVFHVVRCVPTLLYPAIGYCDCVLRKARHHPR